MQGMLLIFIVYGNGWQHPLYYRYRIIRHY